MIKTTIGITIVTVTQLYVTLSNNKKLALDLHENQLAVVAAIGRALNRERFG